MTSCQQVRRAAPQRGTVGRNRAGRVSVRRVTALAVLAALASAGCGSATKSASPGGGSTSTAGAGSGGGGGGAVTVGVLAPFTGVDAALGPQYEVGCLGATHAVNAAGGVLGHTLSCKVVDTRGDPADAVPAARQMFATTSKLGLVVGVTGDEAASVVPVIDANKTVVVAMTGQSEFDNTHFNYFYRLVAPDLAESYAMVAIAKLKGYHRIALAYGNDIGSQTFVKPAIASLAKAGLTLSDNETLDLQATTFRTEATKIVNSHPDAIFTEALGATDATFLSEIKQINGGKMIPIVATQATVDPTWFKSVSAALGASTLAANYVADNVSVDTSGAAYKSFSTNVKVIAGQVSGGVTTYLTAGGTVHLYDGITLAALSMVAAKSTVSAVYRPFMESIGNGTPGATVVATYAEGVAALKAGKAIRYIGPGGPTNFDSYHTSAGIFVLNTYSATGTVNVTGRLTPTELQAVTP